MQQRAETLNDALKRELLELCAERAYLHKNNSRAQVQEQFDGGGEELGVVTSAAKVNRCSGDKLATTYACIDASSLTSHPSLAHFVSGAVKMRAVRTHLCNLINRARRRRSAMVRSRSMRLLLRQPKHIGDLESNSPPLMPAIPLLLSSHILLQQY